MNATTKGKVMGIDVCIKCDALVDEDYCCEVYRPEFDNECVCDNCFSDWESDNEYDAMVSNGGAVGGNGNVGQ